MKHFFLGFVFKMLFVCLCVVDCTSCSDIKLAEELDGTWKGSVTISYDDQSKEVQEVYQKFKYFEDNIDNDGNIVEVRDCQVKDVDLDGMTMDVKYRTYISGTWEVLNGDLYIKYDVSTLKVKISPDDVELRENNALVGLALLAGMLGGYTPYDIVNDLQKDLYKDLFHQYGEDVDDAGEIVLPNLNVSDDVISYESSDVGTVKLKRTNVNLKSILR